MTRFEIALGKQPLMFQFPNFQSPFRIHPTAAEEIEEYPVEPQTMRDDDYYFSILATVGDKNKATILLAGEDVSQLPITIAVELSVAVSVGFGTIWIMPHLLLRDRVLLELPGIV